MANFIIGSEVKFKIELNAIGFNMDQDDFDLDIYGPGVTINGSKEQGGSGDGKLMIFKEEPVVTDSSDSSSSDSSAEEPGEWYAIIDTTGMKKGEIKVIATAHIPDTNASGGVRNEKASVTLGQAVNS